MGGGLAMVGSFESPRRDARSAEQRGEARSAESPRRSPDYVSLRQMPLN
eukprot:COSAG06_NODE_5351_length_3532_cov_2.775415_6_plen_49_part_00